MSARFEKITGSLLGPALSAIFATIVVLVMQPRLQTWLQPQFEVPELTLHDSRSCEFVIKNMKDAVGSFCMVLKCTCRVDSAFATTLPGGALACHCNGDSVIVACSPASEYGSWDPENHPRIVGKGAMKFLTGQSIRLRLFFFKAILRLDSDIVANMMGDKIENEDDIRFSIIGRHNRFRHLPTILLMGMFLVVVVPFIFKYKKSRSVENAFGGAINEHIETIPYFLSRKDQEDYRLVVRLWASVYLAFKNPRSPRAKQIFDFLRKKAFFDFVRRKRQLPP